MNQYPPHPLPIKSQEDQSVGMENFLLSLPLVDHHSALGSNGGQMQYQQYR
jgi:hypothetical protein